MPARPTPAPIHTAPPAESPAAPPKSQPYRPPSPPSPPPPRPPNYAPGAGAPRSQPRRKVVIAAVTLLVAAAGICIGLGVARIATRTTPCPTQQLSATAFQRYSAPGPVTVIGPAGWVNNSDQTDVQDFNPPGSNNLPRSPYMRIGISDRHPQSSMKAEADAIESAILHSPGYTDVKIAHQRMCRFLGVDAADFEYTGANSSGVPRHGIERHWIRAGTTRTLEYATPAIHWGDTARNFFYGLADNTTDH